MIDPRGVTLTQYADALAASLARYGWAERLDAGVDWTLWAERVVELPAIRAQNPPAPHDFSDWREWAHRLALIEGLGD